MTKIAIVYFSGYGHTAKQAEAVHQGVASVESTQVTLLRIDQEGNLPEGWLDVLTIQDAVIYGSPTYMGGQPGNSRSLPTLPQNYGLSRD